MQRIIKIYTNLPGITRLERAIALFFEEVGDVYENSHKVEFTLLSNNAIYVAAAWPWVEQDENECIEIGIETTSYTSFAALFGISSKVKTIIDTITANKLWKLYCIGRAELFCAVDPMRNSGLYFRKEKDRLIFRDTDEKEHVAEGPLETPEQIINYTRSYFSFRSAPR